MQHNLCWKFIITIILLGCLGCGEHSSDTVKPEKTEFNLGEAVNQSIKTYLSQSDNAQNKLLAYSKHESKIVQNINRLVTSSRISNIDPTTQPILKALYRLVENNTLPQATNSSGLLLQEIAKDPKTIQALCDFANNRNGTDITNTLALMHKVLNHEKSQEFWQALAQLIAQNPDLLKHFCELLHSTLTNLPEDETTANAFEFVSHEVYNLDQNWGNPVWIARLDKNNNPKVCTHNNMLFPPFIDSDYDGICDINLQGQPIDKNGQALDIPALSSQEYKDNDGKILIARDGDGRALSPDGEFIFDYYDAKHTVLSVLFYQIGKIFQSHIPEDGLKVTTQLLGPKVTQYDEQGAYLGYSIQNPASQGMLGTLEFFKREQVHLLLRGAVIISRDQEPEAIQQALAGVWEMIAKELRDNPNIKTTEDLAKWFEGFADNPPPQIFPLLQLMLMTEIPDCPYPNMAMVFFYWISSDYQYLSQNLWPMLQALRELEQQHPGMTDSLIERILNWSKWTLTAQIKNDNQETYRLATWALDKAVQELLTDPENIVNKLQQQIKTTIPSRRFANIIECLDRFEPYQIFNQVIISFLQPNDNKEQDVYSELVRVNIGMIQCRKNTVTNIRLFRLLGQFCDPNLPLVSNLLTAFQQLATADWELALLKVANNSVAPNTDGTTPIAIFVLAYLDVIQTIESSQTKEITPQQIECILNNFNDFLLNEHGLLQRVYRVIQKNAGK